MAHNPNSTRVNDRSGYQGFAAAYPDFLEHIAALRARRDRRLAALEAMTRREQHGAVRKLLNSGSLHVLYAYEALRAKRLLRTATPDSIAELARQCSPFSYTREPVQRRAVNRGGKARLVYDFGPIKRMHQLFVGDILRRLHPPRTDQFLLRGGLPMALVTIEEAFREGWTHAVEVDLIDFYGRIRLPGLANLLRPLPEAVTENVVWDHGSRRSRDDDVAVSPMEDDPSASGLVGLSLGAATSPVVGERIIRHLLDTAQMGQVVTYADNILVLGRGEEDAARRAEHLREVACGLEAGPLALRIGTPSPFHSDHGYVEFASQWGRAIRHRLDWMPNGHKQLEYLYDEDRTGLTLEDIEKAEKKVVRMRHSFPQWRTGDGWQQRRLAELAALRYFRNAQPENLDLAVNRLMVAHLTSGLDLLELLPAPTTERHDQRRMRLCAEAARHLADLRGIAA